MGVQEIANWEGLVTVSPSVNVRDHMVVPD